jgi:co-chaperonin GroES (HSP10)
LKEKNQGGELYPFKKGDTVMIDPRTEAVRATIEGKEYLMVGEHQVLGILL